MDRVDVHPEPTTATLKELYAHAFRCARPGCRKPLYTQDDDTGDRTLNSRVAHIHARRRGGPRWIEMDSSDNRAATNLVLLCIEHSYEVDDHEDRFPADMLREWKAEQLAEHQTLLEGWTLTDDKAAEVQRASFQVQAQAYVDAATLADLARTVEAASAAARRLRAGPRAEVSRAGETWAQARAGLVAWDSETGERLYAEPPMIDQRAHLDAVRASLREVGQALVSLIDRVGEEVAAIRRARPDTNAWTDWVRGALDGLHQASTSWPAPLPTGDDGRVERAIAELDRAAGALDRRSRGQDAETPPAPTPPTDPPDPSTADLAGRAHHQLLESARPFARVDSRPYDAVLRERIAEATAFGATLEPTPAQWPFGLQATAGLAAEVAGNASESQLVALAAADRGRRPLCAAVLLLDALADVADRRGYDSAAAGIRAVIVELFDDTDWASADAWVGCEVYGAAMFERIAALSSPETVSRRLADALEAAPQRAVPMLLSCAQWVEHRDSRNPTQPVPGTRNYDTRPAWLPVEDLIAALPTSSAGSQASPDDRGDYPDYEQVERLRRELLAR